MCFSPTASFATAGLLTLIGTLCIRTTKSKRAIPFALIPLIFAIQQACEGFVWISYPWPIAYFFAVLFIFIALSWPMWIPYSLYSLEPNKKRRLVLWYDTIAGTLLSIGAFFMVARHGIDVAIINHSIAYKLTDAYQEIPTYGAWLLWVWYRLTVVVPSFLSSFKEINFLGALLLISDALAYLFWKTTFTSVWCFFAAGISIWVFYVLKRIHLK